MHNKSCFWLGGIFVFALLACPGRVVGRSQFVLPEAPSPGRSINITDKQDRGELLPIYPQKSFDCSSDKKYNYSSREREICILFLKEKEDESGYIDNFDDDCGCRYR
jgi:hypothetical protein